MKRMLRDVMVGAVSSAAAVGVGVWQSDAAAQANPAPATPPGPQAPGVAGEADVAQPGVPIRNIIVEGNQRIEPSTVTSYLLLRPGDLIEPARLDLSLKTLFATGLFADVQISQRGPDLVVRVVENPIISEVIFEGNRTIKEENLQKEVQARPRGVFTAARAQADVQKIIEQYRRSGRFAATVTPRVREREQNRVDLIFDIDEGPVTGVRGINFIGNEAYSDADLREAMLTEESRWWRIFSKNDNFDPDRLEYDRELLRQFYTNRGYADFRVVSATAELTPDQKDFYITITVDEGAKYDFGEIKVDTKLDRVPAELLRAVIPIQEGAVFEGELIEKSIDAMTFTAGTSGYANVDINPRIDRDAANRKVNITFEVDEGARVFVERIDIVGNTRTVDNVIRRELRLAEGDAFNRVLLDRSRSRIRALGFFKQVEVQEREGSQPDRAVVEVQVEEDSTGELAFAAGYSSTDNFLLDASISQRNLRGRGQYLRLRGSTSRRRQTVDIRFTEPRFLGRNLAAGVDLFSLRTDYLNISSFQNQSTGLGLRASFPITDTTGMGVSFTVRQDDTEIADIPVTISSGNTTLTVDQCDRRYSGRPILCDQEGVFMTSVLGYSFNWDRRNDPIAPTRGFDFSLQQDFAGLGGDVKYLRTEVQGGAYRGLLPGVTASFTLQAGYVFGWDDDNVRINDRFFKGGSSFRGFDVAGIGPRQILVSDDGDTRYLDSLGGNGYYIGTLEFTVPTFLPKEYGLEAALFAEFGGLGILDERAKVQRTFESGGRTFTSFVDDALSLRASAGLSIFWDSPFGPVQFDFAEPFLAEDYDNTETFRFSQRTRF